MQPSKSLQVRARVESSEHERPRLELSHEFGPGMTAVMGPSGAGKSTLLATIAGLVEPSRGEIILGSRVLFSSEKPVNLPTHLRRVALVFQSLALFPHLCVWKNVAYGLRDVAANQRKDQAMHWLRKARVDHLCERFPATLSGGEAQRVAIARALACLPHALLLDEPFSALDRSLRCELREELALLVGETQLPTLLVTHDHEDVAALDLAIVSMQAGHIVSKTPCMPNLLPGLG